MSMQVRSVLYCLAAGLWSACLFAAPPETEVAGSPDGSTSQAPIAQWVQALGSDRFQERQEATAKLVETGKPVVKPVTRAARTGDLETATRCIEVLRQLYESDKEQTKQAAKEALTELTKSENKSVAQRAAAAMEDRTVPKNVVNPFGNAQVQIRIGGRVAAGPGQNVKVEVDVNNGRRNVNVEENGRKIRITDTNGKDITVVITEKKGGKEKTTKVEAKNLEELKKKNPEAAKLYRKYAANQNVGRAAVIGNIRIGGNPAPAFPVPIGRAAGQAKRNRDAAKKLADTREKLAETLTKLKTLAGEGKVDPQTLRKLAEKIEEAENELRDIQRRLQE